MGSEAGGSVVAAALDALGGSSFSETCRTGDSAVTLAFVGESAYYLHRDPASGQVLQAAAYVSGGQGFLLLDASTQQFLANGMGKSMSIPGLWLQRVLAAAKAPDAAYIVGTREELSSLVPPPAPGVSRTMSAMSQISSNSRSRVGVFSVSQGQDGAQALTWSNPGVVTAELRLSGKRVEELSLRYQAGTSKDVDCSLSYGSEVEAPVLPPEAAVVKARDFTAAARRVGAQP